MTKEEPVREALQLFRELLDEMEALIYNLQIISNLTTETNEYYESTLPLLFARSGSTKPTTLPL